MELSQILGIHGDVILAFIAALFILLSLHIVKL